jgi:hypothetical protein
VVNNVRVFTYGPHQSHMLSPVDSNWARHFKRRFTENYQDFVKEGVIELHLGVDKFRSAAARQRAVMVAAGVAAYQATMNIRTCARAFDLSDISLCNWDDGERLITTSKFVTDRDESHDPLLDFETANPNRFHTGIRQLTSPEFLTDLRARQAQRRQAPVPVEEVASDDEEGEELELPDDQMEELNRDRVRGARAMHEGSSDEER